MVPGVYSVLPEYPNGPNNILNLIAGLGVQTDEDAPDSNTIFPNQLEIDYIRVYQRDQPSSDDFDCEVLLYPNPSFGSLMIKKKRMTLVRIENMLGEILFSQQVRTDEIEVNVRNFTAGIYFVEVQSDDGTFANKFIKE